MESLPLQYDITLTKSTSWLEVLYCLDDNGDTALVTGCTAVLQVRSAYDGTLLFTFSTANGKLALSIENGTIEGDTVPSDLSALVNGPAVYSLVVTFPDSKAYEWYTGAAILRTGVVS